MKKTIAIVQTSNVSAATLKALCDQILPGVQVHMLSDDSLIREINACGGPTLAVRRRLYQYFQAAASLGVDLILNQCSSVGEVVDMIQPFVDVPIVKIDEPMAKKAVELGRKIAMIATVATTVQPSSRLIEAMALKAGKDIVLDKCLVEGAMMMLIEKGDVKAHNDLVLGAVEAAARDNDVIVLAQGSMTVLLPLLSHVQKPVLTSPQLAIEHLRDLLFSVT